jgi:hypothetical protein
VTTAKQKDLEARSLNPSSLLLLNGHVIILYLMPSPTSGCRLLLSIILLFPFLSDAAIQRLDSEFAGEATESWESYSRANVSGLVNTPLPIFGGKGTISGQNEYIWITQYGIADPNTGGFGLGGFAARAHDGTQGYGTSLSYATSRITLVSPAFAFGGYWGTDYPSNPIHFAFYDSQGALIGSDDRPYTAPNQNGTLEWFGWQSTTPISRIDYSGPFVVNDSLRIGAVPEPSTCLLIVLGAAFLLSNSSLQPKTRLRRREN